MENDVTCDTASYDKMTLANFLYQLDCAPRGWKGFFAEEQVKTLITNNISPVIAGQPSLIEPPMHLMFRALKEVSPDKVKAVIVGQDPYPKRGRATGLAFSLSPKDNTRDPSALSVLNILVELRLEGVEVKTLENGDLTPWLKQGVLLLNSAFTVIKDVTGSHLDLWEPFTDLLAQYVSKNIQSSAWILLGQRARRAIYFIDLEKHYVKEGGDPSVSSGRNEFIGGSYFVCANQFLRSKKRKTISWDIEHSHRPGPGGGDRKPC